MIDIDENQAKEVLDYLVKRLGFVSLHIKFHCAWNNMYKIHVGCCYGKSNPCYYLYYKGDIFHFFLKPNEITYSNILRYLLKIATCCNLYIFYNRHEIIFLEKGTTLESILIDIDLHKDLLK